jgi:hypothetical protein
MVARLPKPRKQRGGKTGSRGKAPPPFGDRERAQREKELAVFFSRKFPGWLPESITNRKAYRPVIIYEGDRERFGLDIRL